MQSSSLLRTAGRRNGQARAVGGPRLPILAPASVVVFGNYGNGNLGDEATLQALLGLLASRVPRAEIVAFAVNPRDTAQRHGIRALPATRLAARATPILSPSADGPAPLSPRGRAKAALRRVPIVYRALRGGLRVVAALVRLLRDPLLEVRQLRILRTADCLVIGGGGQLSEPVEVLASFPMQVLKMTLFAKVAGTKVLILNVGAIPLERRSTRLLVRTALKLADYCAVRDERSRSVAERIGAPSPDVYPDLAYALAPENGSARELTRTVAINVFPHCDGRYLPVAGDRYDTYLERLSELTIELLRRGYSAMLLQTQLRADPPALADLKARLAEKAGWEAVERQLVERSIDSVDDVLEVLASSDVVVGTRYHSVVLGFGVGRPVLALAAHVKVAQEMTEMGQERFLFQIDEADPAALLTVLEQLEADGYEAETELARRVAEKRAQLDEEFDRLFGPVRRDGASEGFRRDGRRRAVVGSA